MAVTQITEGLHLELSQNPQAKHIAIHCLHPNAAQTQIWMSQRNRPAELAQDAEAVELWHLDVERHHVRVEAFDGFERTDAVAGRADDLDVSFRLQHARQRAADDRRIVDDEESDGAHGEGRNAD